MHLMGLWIWGHIRKDKIHRGLAGEGARRALLSSLLPNEKHLVCWAGFYLPPLLEE